MKSKAIILFIIFSLVQFGPAIKALLPDSDSIVFAIDEEKHSGESEKSADDGKNSKEFSKQILALRFFDHESQVNIDQNDCLNLSPVFDILTPPPDRA